MIQTIIRNIYERIIEDANANVTVVEIVEDIAKHLEEFDHTWV